MVKNILFDFDGTLVNTNDVILASWQYTYRHYLGHEMPVEHITACFGEPLLITMAREFPGVPPEESAEVYRTYQVEHAAELVTVFPGVKEMLASLQAAGYRLGIVTSRTRESAMRYMNQLEIASFFYDANAGRYDMVTCEDTAIHKPNPEPLLLGLEKVGGTAENSIMIGDSPFDIKCANNAGVRSVLVDWRITCDDTSLIDDAKADFVVKKPADLVELVAKL